MAVSRAPGEWTEWVALLAGVLDERFRWRLLPLLLGMLFASGGVAWSGDFAEGPGSST